MNFQYVAVRNLKDGDYYVFRTNNNSKVLGESKQDLIQESEYSIQFKRDNIKDLLYFLDSNNIKYNKYANGKITILINNEEQTIFVDDIITINDNKVSIKKPSYISNSLIQERGNPSDYMNRIKDEQDKIKDIRDKIQKTRQDADKSKDFEVRKKAMDVITKHEQEIKNHENQIQDYQKILKAL
jgi:vacuolar-type H+-ATPase subunit I/STV1